jgi:hypothetical protein
MFAACCYTRYIRSMRTGTFNITANVILYQEFCKKLYKKMEFYFQSNSVMNSLKCPKLKSLSHCFTEFFPFYQNKHWTIQQREDRSVDPSFHCIKMKIVGFFVLDLL